MSENSVVLEDVLVGFPHLNGNFKEIELLILKMATLTSPTVKFECVCRSWWRMMRWKDFREGHVSHMCQSRLDNFPGYKIIPPWLELKGWNYLVTSKMVVQIEGSSQIMGTVIYDNDKTMYEGYFINGNVSVVARFGYSGQLAISTPVPNGRGILYHRNHEAMMLPHDIMTYQTDNYDEDLLEDILELEALKALYVRTTRYGMFYEESVEIREEGIRIFNERIEMFKTMNVNVGLSNYESICDRLAMILAIIYKKKHRADFVEDETNENVLVDVLNSYFNRPEIPSLVIYGLWNAGYLVSGTIHRFADGVGKDGTLIARFDKYVGAGCWDGEFRFPRDTVRFIGTFYMNKPISHDLETLDLICNRGVNDLFVPLIGNIISTEGELGDLGYAILDTFPKVHQSEMVNRLNLCKTRQIEIDDKERKRYNM